SAGAFYTSDGAFRWALLNSNGNRVTTDFAGNNTSGISSGATFSTWTGYQGDSAVAGTPNANTLQIRERKGSGDSLFTGSNWDVRSAGNTIATSTADVAVVLDVTRTAAGVTIGTSYGGSSISYVDTSATTTSFDTIAFFTVDGLTKDIILSNIKVETLIIPEPASAWLGALGFAGFAFRRKRNA
ncbi:MAG TPA: PEP-CTERM sorting domain-containing protein, partial [Luteolibacter sp.]|nr:PEP-CTERM sorting domain-containing protein [Luteolibacter sp.]